MYTVVNTFAKVLFWGFFIFLEEVSVKGCCSIFLKIIYIHTQTHSDLLMILPLQLEI